MKNKNINLIDKALAFCFYLIFFLVPLIMYPSTSELFEFNKMWVVFGITLLVLFFWVAKAILLGKFEIKKTPLDLPLLLFASSQVLSTMFSIDRHVSLWGYYSRFNGGLLSILSYILLYYAFTTNLALSKKPDADGKRHKPISLKILLVSLAAGSIVSLWGIPSHFGYDPTCLIFRGTFDVSCWTDAFQPKVRIFSTLGQPNWLAAYLGILIPISLVFAVKNSGNQTQNLKQTGKFSISSGIYFLLAILFFIALIYSGSQSGFLALTISLLIFAGLYFLKVYKEKGNLKKLVSDRKAKILIGTGTIFIIIVFLIGDPISTLNKFTLKGLKTKLSQKQIVEKTEQKKEPGAAQMELGGTDSGKIRLIVWKGALKIFAHYPIFGSGIETFAFSYYQFKPAEHNLTSEWDYLYNKAHNEYLNYLATTGALGFGSYIFLIGAFLYLAISKFKTQNSKLNNNLISYPDSWFLSLGLLAGYISILISNFFGFSVVIVNLFLFLIPAFFFDINGNIQEKQTLVLLGNTKTAENAIGSEIRMPAKTIFIFILTILLLYFEIILFRFWLADQNYALGNNYDKIGYYPLATDYLKKALDQRPGEDIFKDELGVNLSVIAFALKSRNQATESAALAASAKILLDEVIEKHPNNVIFYRSRTKALYALSQVDEKYFKDALSAIKQAQILAPTDAKIAYNLGLLYEKDQQTDKAIKALKNAISLKTNYADPRQALAVFYIQIAKSLENTDSNQAEELRKQAKDELNYILTNIDPNDTTAKSLLEGLK